ncbi:MAG: glucose 1-dehydrogenase [Candidatus Tectomicrobia bacterium]|nr:glucose 1-dehydrogenase [Candidatus Tectomicrobia bacterium]
MSLQGKVAIVTGAAGGIGQAYAKALAAAGASVVVADIKDGGATVAAITAAGGLALALACDVSDETSSQAMVRQAVDHFGGVDVLVNNAAMFAGVAVKPFDLISVEEWDHMMAVNVRGTFLCCRAVVPAMRERGKGKIINVSSSTILYGTPLLLHYVTSKGAVMALTRALAREVGRWNICVNSIAPGITLSDAVKEHPRMAKWDAAVVQSRCIRRSEFPEDLTGTILYLASDASDFVTGQFITVDGGTSMH